MKNVLVVDDEPFICKWIKISLESTGDYNVLVCTDSREAFQIVKTHRPDIILIDVHMPRLSGPQLVRQIMTDETVETIPCVYVTGDLAPPGRDGATRYITKPFQRSELIALIAEVLKEKDRIS